MDWSIPNIVERLFQLHTWSMLHFQILKMRRTVSIPSFAIALSKLKKKMLIYGSSYVTYLLTEL